MVAESEAELRFRFGKNWSRFLAALNDDRIAEAVKSLQAMLGVADLHGKRFLDVGSGSGLFSLAARRLGARVHSFDFDADSVACTAELRRRFFTNDPDWTVERGSVLDREYLGRLGRFEIVYSWGVLHHTGAMWEALENVIPLVAPAGMLFIAIYNDQGGASRRWRWVKRTYNRLPTPARFPLTLYALARLWASTFARDLLKSGNPLHTWRLHYKQRGMSAWRDVIDWVGGYPFEVARPEEIFEFYKARGFALEKLKTCVNLGINEFVFRRGSGS